MAEIKKKCANCCELNDWWHPRDTRLKCDLTDDFIKLENTCSNWEPNDETELQMLRDRLRLLKIAARETIEELDKCPKYYLTKSATDMIEKLRRTVESDGK